MMTEKKTSLPDDIKVPVLINRIAIAVHDGDEFADRCEQLEFQAHALIALDEIGQTDPNELRLVLDWLRQTENLPSIRSSRNNGALQ
jgi:hypothetical protein